MFYVYILYSHEADRYYIGQSSDVYRRLEEHNHPVEYKKFTAKYQQWKPVLFFRVSDNRADAIFVERFIKKQKSRDFIKKLIKQKKNKEYFDYLLINILKRK